MLTILSAIFVFGVLVTVHEFGHFIVAKLTGMRVEEFAIGFGPQLYQTKEGDTTYSLRIIPLGGYNKIAGMDPEDPPEPGSFKSKSIPARMAVILAGAIMNFILPILLFTGIFLVEGVELPSDKPVLGFVMEDMAAAKAGLKAGDKILSINGKPIDNWSEVVTTLRANGAKPVEIKAESQGKVQSYTMTPEYKEEYKRTMVGITPELELSHPGFVDSVKMSFSYTKTIIVKMIEGLSQMVLGKAAAEVSGPIGVAQMAGQVAEKGLLPLMSFVAFLSINLGVINLLPLPALDGGHVVLLVLEALRGKPLGNKAMNNIQLVGIALILAITAFSTFKDITRF